MSAAQPAVSVVIITRNRRGSLLRTLDHLIALPDDPEIIVVDNASSDGTARAVEGLAADSRRVHLIRLDRNLGAPGRNVGVEAASSDVIAFCDDDSWWGAGSLTRAAELLSAHRTAAVLVGSVWHHPSGQLDAVSRKMAAARLGRQKQAPGPAILSFPAFAAVVRREVFRDVGGFHPLLFFGGEERLFALDVAAAGHQLCYVPELTVHHAAESGALTPDRWSLHQRNDCVVDWMRRPLGHAGRATARLAAHSLRDPHAARATAGVLQRLPRALAARRPVPSEIHRALAAEDLPLSGSRGSRSD